MSFSTFELPIRKLIKLILIIGTTSAIIGTITFCIIASQVGMFKPDATSILGNAIFSLHAQNPALFLVYGLFGVGTYTIYYFDRKHQKQEKQKKIQDIFGGLK